MHVHTDPHALVPPAQAAPTALCTIQFVHLLHKYSFLGNFNAFCCFILEKLFAPACESYGPLEYLKEQLMNEIANSDYSRGSCGSGSELCLTAHSNHTSSAL